MTKALNALIYEKIFTILNKQIMFDFDLAQMYGVETRVLKQAVKRNIVRFPPDFMFMLTKMEWNEVITTCDNLPENIKFRPVTPYSFTEQGVAMLSSVLKIKNAIEVNINIIRAFVFMRKYALSHSDLNDKSREMEKKYDVLFSDISEVINYLLQKDSNEKDNNNRKKIGFV